jgi:hypothetical protein
MRDRSTPDRTAHRPTSTRTRLLTVLATLAGLVLALVPAAAAQDAPFDRGTDRSCRTEVRNLDIFDDVPRGLVHAQAIDCVWAYGIVQGRTAFDYAPNAPVTRQQMATFVANMLRQILDRYHVLPEASRPDVRDADDIARVHRPNVASLMEAGIVAGYPDRTFRPALVIDRAQVASFLTRAIEDVIGRSLPRRVTFSDVEGTHRANIEKLASIGVVQGRSDGTYGPGLPTTRAQMATLVARALDFLAAEGVLVPVSYAHVERAADLGLRDVRLGAQAGFDRATFELTDGEGRAGWRIRYVDEARAQGSGDLIEVEGDAVIQLILEGMALPPDLDEPTWDAGRIGLDGAAIVEVVDDGVFEGQHQLFIGTTDVLPFTIRRLAGPQRVIVDVVHP